MSMLASTHKPGTRLTELSPFELEPEPGREPGPAPSPATPFTRSAYGCVEWFQYLDYPTAVPQVPPPERGAGRR